MTDAEGADLYERTMRAVEARSSLVRVWVDALAARGLSPLTAAVLVAAGIERAQRERRGRRGWPA